MFVSTARSSIFLKAAVSPEKIELPGYRGSPGTNKKPPERRFRSVCRIDLMCPFWDWNWHLAEQVAGRSRGQVPHASHHEYEKFRQLYNVKTEMSIPLLSYLGYHILLTDLVKG